MVTNYQDGIYNYGTPVGSRYGWKSTATPYFVDGTAGSDAYDGTTPDLAKATVQAGLALMNAYDVLYIMENAFVGTDPTYYQGTAANHTIAVANTGVAIVGVSHAGQLGYPMTPYLMGMAATETPLFTVNAPLVAIENLHFSGGWANSNTTTAGIVAPDSLGTTSTSVPQGISIHNCSFEDMEGATPTMSRSYPASTGAITIVGTWYSVINHCRFRNCVLGIMVISATSTAVCNTIQNCIFYADATTDVNVDIAVNTSGLANVTITDNYFAHNLPTYASGDSLRYVYISGSSHGIVANNHCGHSATRTAGAAGDGIISPDTCGVSVNYSECALMGAA